MDKVFTLNRVDQYVPTGIYTGSQFTEDLVVKCRFCQDLVKLPIFKIDQTNFYCVLYNDCIYLLENYDPFDKIYYWHPGKYQVSEDGRNLYNYLYYTAFQINQCTREIGTGRYFYQASNTKVYFTHFDLVSGNCTIDQVMPHTEIDKYEFNKPSDIRNGSIVPDTGFSQLFFYGEPVTVWDYSSSGEPIYATNANPQKFKGVNLTGEIDDFGYLHSMQSFNRNFPIVITGNKVNTVNTHDVSDYKLYDEMIVPAKDGLYLHKGARVDYIKIAPTTINNRDKVLFMPVKNPGSNRLAELELSPLPINEISIPGLSGNNTDLDATLAYIRNASATVFTSADYQKALEESERIKIILGLTRPSIIMPKPGLLHHLILLGIIGFVAWYFYMEEISSLIDSMMNR